MYLSRRSMILGLPAIGLAPRAFALEPRLAAISTTTIMLNDVVEAQQGRNTLGHPMFSHRQKEMVRWFANQDNHNLYLANPGNYPDLVRTIPGTAFFGVDLVAYLPGGANDEARNHKGINGMFQPGEPDNYTAHHHGARFAFARNQNRLAFLERPQHYIPIVGGYCLGAMSQGRPTPGDPRNALFIPEAGMWAFYGSDKGPPKWKKMTSDERRSALLAARDYYARRIAVAA